MPSNSIYIEHVKPVLDFSMAFLLSIICFPIVLGIVILYLLSGEKPLLFVQKRVGMGDHIFKIFKFRSLTTRIDDNGEEILEPFLLGSILRKTSLDEIPQLWNVLKQEMSLVGPRPLLVDYLDRYSDVQRKRHLLKPGITGWAQVNGRNELEWNKRLELDLYYVANISFLLDIKILALTVYNYFFANDVVPDFDEPFEGSN